MHTAELDTLKLRKQVIDRVQTLDSRSLMQLLFFIDHNNVEDDTDDDITIDLDFPTPQTPEEARKETEEIEEEIKQGKCMSLDEFVAHTHQKLNKYENYVI
ncbi:MAG: hypothetical protein K6F33_05005 [Bacteroidales bacterium]|nr:hypothetical protein [Bacteroidales bacterium]